MTHPILFLHGSSGGYGADLQLYALATQLDSARFTPLVVLPERGPLAERLTAAGIEIYYTPLAVLRRSVLRGTRALETIRLLARNRHELGLLVKQRGVALVHSNMSILLAGQPVADETRVPHVVHVREIFHGTGGRIGNALWPLYRRQLERADALVCVSAATARQFNGSSTTSVLYDGVARSLVLPPRSAARVELALPENEFVVAVTGRISDWKGQQVVVRALAHEALAEIGAIGLFAGDAAPGQEQYELALSRLAHELGVDDRLHLVGFRNDVATVLAAADAVAVPSIYEDPLPQSALEAASLGLPVVASKRGGLPEIIRDGITGRLVPAGDHAALALALRQLADDPSRAQELATAGAADIAARFSSKRMVEQVEQCYERLIR